jgi:ABC-2 type transport system permease protein
MKDDAMTAKPSAASSAKSSAETSAEPPSEPAAARPPSASSQAHAHTPRPGAALWFARVLAAFVRRELAELSRYRMLMLTRALTLALAVVSLYFFARFVGAAHNLHLDRYGGDYLAFGMVGLLAAELQQVGVAALAHRVRVAQMMGYLEAQLASPAPTWIVLGVAPVYEFGAAALRSALYLIGAALLLGVSFARASVPALALVVPLVFAAFVGLGLLTAAGTMLARRANPVAALLGAASLFLSGVLYPVSVLPGWLQALGRGLPLTHALEGLRQALLVGASPTALAPTLLALAAFAAVLVPAGLALFGFALRRARIDGSLTHY